MAAVRDSSVLSARADSSAAPYVMIVRNRRQDYSYGPGADDAVASVGGDTTVIYASIIDSISADTASGVIPDFIPVGVSDSIRQAQSDSLAAIAAIPPSGAKEGIEPIDNQSDTGSALIGLMMGTLILASYCADGLYRALKTYRHELLGVRRRPNVFDEGHSASFSMTMVLMLIYVVFGGIVVYNLPGPVTSTGFGGAVSAMGLLGVYTLFRFTAYETVGYTFGRSEDRRKWVDGFIASECFAGLALIVPSILMVFRPEYYTILLIISLSIASISRLLFIIKGLRIFYTGIGSLLYFILYLCTLEIIPGCAVYVLSTYLRDLSA